jgi:hypothetical protein
LHQKSKKILEKSRKRLSKTTSNCPCPIVTFLKKPDAYEQHEIKWHQWGIIGHTKKFVDAFDKNVYEENDGFLKTWGIRRDVKEHLDGKYKYGEYEESKKTKEELLRISMLLHDLGKFQKKKKPNGEFDYSDHEKKSYNKKSLELFPKLIDGEREKLIDAVMQVPVNICIAKKYFELISGTI